MKKYLLVVFGENFRYNMFTCEKSIIVLIQRLNSEIPFIIFQVPIPEQFSSNHTQGPKYLSYSILHTFWTNHRFTTKPTSF